MLTCDLQTMQKLSRLFWPVLVTPKNSIIKDVEALSKSQKLMQELGLIKSSTNGTYNYMPLFQRSLDKLCALVQETMRNVDAQKITMPILTNEDLWRKSGRLNGDVTEFFILSDRHGKKFLLSPTHEESITAILSAIAPISYKQLPIRLYQIGSKFRDELKARFGIVRAKEFLMKDLYAFDRSIQEANETYDLIKNSYIQLFQRLQVPIQIVEANSGMMGGNKSHEFHFLSSIGEDRLLCCQNCQFAINLEEDAINQNEKGRSLEDTCLKCQSTNVICHKGIEVAHTFLLGDKYTQQFGATYLDSDGKPKALTMSSYGIGLSRVIAAALEVLSTDKELKWPTLLAPYDVCIIGPKQGSKEQTMGDIIEQQLCKEIADICGINEILHDDRKHLTIGKRLMHAKRMGYPIIVVIGGKSMEEPPKCEIFINGEQFELYLTDILLKISLYNKQKLAM